MSESKKIVFSINELRIMHQNNLTCLFFGNVEVLHAVLPKIILRCRISPKIEKCSNFHLKLFIPQIFLLEVWSNPTNYIWLDSLTKTAGCLDSRKYKNMYLETRVIHINLFHLEMAILIRSKYGFSLSIFPRC